MRHILVLNAGSSSVKFAFYVAEGDALRLGFFGFNDALATAPRFSARDANGTLIGEETWPAGARLGHKGAIEHLLAFVETHTAGAPLAAVGHRVVHGGTEFDHPARVDAGLLDRLEALVPLAPLHQPHNLAAIRVLRDRAPELPQVACFDTSFHRTQPPEAATFALPAELREKGIQRYGFHGLSYEFIAGRLREIDTRAAEGRTVVAHLGAGASLCAMRAGRSIATTMGFTALDGIPMATRSGALDPGVILHLLRAEGCSLDEVEEILYHRSGLLGLSGLSGDMRAIEASDDPRARFAMEVFAYRIGREIGSLAAALGGLDALVFTAGIGENSARVRAMVARHVEWLGLSLDAEANAKSGPCISTGASKVSAWVVPTDEALVIARHTARVADTLAT